MSENCKNCDEKQACVPFFAHENVLMHYNRANRRMLIALIVVCVTFIMTIVVFVTGYTQREKNWLDTLNGIRGAEVTDGLHEQSDP
jgi:hypothetical protein